MTLRNISMALLLSISAPGCAGEGEGGGDGDLCDVLQTECTGNTICEEGECVGVFDRSYEIGLTVLRDPEKCRGARLDDPNCVHPRAMVYFNEGADPILSQRDALDVAEIDVSADSRLLVELHDRKCPIELTSEILRGGSGWCIGSWAAARLSLDLMPVTR